MSWSRQITRAGAQPAESTGTLQRASGAGYLGSKEVLSRDLPYRSAGCCLSSQPSLPRGCSLSLLFSVTAGGRRKWEPLCLVPVGAHCFGSGGVSGLQLLCLWLVRPESVSDGVSAEQPLSPGGGQWIEAPMSVENKPSVTGLLQLQDGSGNSPASILGGRMLPVLPKDGGARSECC